MPVAEHLQEAALDALIKLAGGQQAHALGEEAIAQALAHALLLLDEVGDVQGASAVVVMLGDLVEGLGVVAQAGVDLLAGDGAQEAGAHQIQRGGLRAVLD